jgi:electron transport complex protein RnfA
MIFLAALGVCASLGMNLLVQFGLGLGILAVKDMDLAPPPACRLSAAAGALVLCATLFILWIFFTYVLAPLGPGFYWYLLLYPLSVSLMKGLDKLRKKALPTAQALEPFFCFSPGRGSTRGFAGGSGAVEFLPLGLFIAIHLALRPSEALFLSFCFSLGIFFSLEILREIRRRSHLEAVPRFLRGLPLSLISLGLLSLIFSSVALMFFNLFRLGKVG